MNPKRCAAGTIAFLAAAAGPATAAERLVFNSVAPCRIIDTRFSAAGALAANETRTFHVVGSTSDFAGQGGQAGGCGLPGFAGPGQPQVQAVLINFVAVSATGAGDLKGWASDGPVPNASIINYAKVTDETFAGVPLNIANGIGLPVRQDVEGGDISLKADVSGTHVVADVVGYWRTLTLPPGAVGTPQIADGSVTGAKIANGAVVRSLNAQTDTVTLAATNGLSVSAGGGAVTVTSNATPNNTASRIVSRDSLGNFSAGTVSLTQLFANTAGIGSAVSGTQNGGGPAGSFSINNVGNNAPAVFASTNSTSGATAVGVWGQAIASPTGIGISGTGTQNGLWGRATGTTGYVTGAYAEAVASPNGVGVAGRGTQNGVSATATGTTGFATAVIAEATADPTGTGVFANGGGSGVVAQSIGTSGFTIGLNAWSVANPSGIGGQGIGAGTGLIGTTQSCADAGVPGGCATPGIAGQFVTGNGGTVLLGQVAIGNTWTPVFRVDSTGKGFFNGGTQTGGADFAESVAVANSANAYGPGDLLAIDAGADRRLALATEPYSTLIAGIYSTKPGILATRHPMDDATLKEEVPVAIVGIVPCKVSAENGPIGRGDLLVSSSTPGFAMKGTDGHRMLGAVVGKAMGRLREGKGVIEVLVTLQ